MKKVTLLLLCTQLLAAVALADEPRKIQVKEYPSLYRTTLGYYDYDGDGVMEMFGFYKPQKGAKYCFCLMDDEKVIEDYGKGYVEEWGKPYIKDGNIIRYANGNGQLMVGNVFKLSNGWKIYSDIGTHSDLDNDGRVDIGYVLNSTPTLMKQQYDASFFTTTPVIEKDSAYLAKLMANINKADPLALNIIVHGLYYYQDQITGFSQSIDLNGDGRLDLLSQDGKSALLSVDENTYCQIGFTGSIYPYDLNADGILDYLLYDGENVYTVMCNERGESVQKKIFSNPSIRTFICRDFDHDGDVDVLAFIRESSNTIFVFLRNDGNGTFKKKESYIEENTIFIECKDYDADGLYEVLVGCWKTYKNGPVNKIIKVNDNYSLTDVSENLTETMSKLMMNLGDFDNDGYTDFKLVNGYIGNNFILNEDAPHMTGLYSKQTKQNTAPKKMSKPIVTLDESTGFLRIIWEQGEDAQTSACDLTYEVRIGTAPGDGDILRVPSLADGRRRVIAEGSMGSRLQTLFNISKYEPGTYYVAVQAIDAGGLGGAWSDEAIYENAYNAPTILATTQQASTVDVLKMVADKYEDNVTYRWSVTNGEVKSHKKDWAQVTFHAAGVQQVNLTTIRDDGGEYYSKPINIYVNAYQKNEDANQISPDKIFDLNQDGYADGIYQRYFYYNDKKGNLIKYPKSFNTNMDLQYPVILDVNRDGFPDVMGYSSKGDFFINDEEGDFDIEKRDYTINGLTPKQDNMIGDYLYTGVWVDFTNTGGYDVITYYSYYVGNGGLLRTNDYSTYNYLGNYDGLLGDNYNKNMFIYDFNHDGFMDIITYKLTKTDNGSSYFFYAFINDGKGGFETKKIWEDPQPNACYFADMNNDGYIDIIKGGSAGSSGMGMPLRFYYKPMTIYLGQPDYSFTLAATIGSNCGIRDIHDYDNNGYLDVCVSSGDGISQIIYFDRDLQYCVVNPLGSIGNPFIVMSDNGYPNNQLSTIKNIPPTAPARVSVKQTAAGMVINWDDAKDDHTPAVQMRYNVSVKRKGKTGENSYVISPMNGGSSKSNLVFPNYYKQSTTMTVPITALTAGETYEVQVQAIDLWNQYSPMSEPVEITINASDSYIDVVTMACLGRETKVKYIGAQQEGMTTDFGEDGKLIKTEDNEYTVVWSSEGVKDITIGNVHSQVIVQHPIDVTFSLPDEIFVGAELPIAVNEEMATSGNKSSFEIESAPDGAKCSIVYEPHNRQALLSFNKPGNYTITAKNEDPILNNSYSLSFEAKEAIQAGITSVDVLGEHYAINWNTEQPVSISKAIIYKEGNSLNNYNVLDTVDIKNGQYVDLTSSPQTISVRYKIAYLSDGGQIFETPVHKPLHLMVGFSAQGGYTLMWNAYEGLEVDNYRIWRGTSSDKMEVVAQVAGSQLNYTDMNAPTGEVFYAVSFTPIHQTSIKRQSNAFATGDDISSNIVSTKSAANIILASSLSIITLTEDPQLTTESPTLQLYSLELPSYCTNNRVAWSIVEGEELATISTSGLLVAKEGKGVVKVRVSSLDGSNLKDEISIPVDIQMEDAVIDIKEQTTSIVTTRWFSLSGTMLPKRPSKGVFIEAEFLSNGTIRTKKKMVK